MTDRRRAETGKEICSKCHKKIASERRAGSLTSYLFKGLDCQCSSSISEIAGSNWTSSGESDFCPNCGLKIEEKKHDGSLTGFLFQSTRCKCQPDPAMVEGRMSAKFWKLKKAGIDSIFVSANNEAETAAEAGDSIGLAAGAIIGGAYKIVELIGKGGMGEVYLARHETLNYYFHSLNTSIAESIPHSANRSLRSPGHDPFLEAERLPKSAKPESTTATSAIKWDGKPFYRGREDGQGIKFRIWCLPPDGEIPFYFVGPHAFASITDNTGKVLVPMEAKVWVVFKKEMFEHQELITGLTDGSFERLDVAVGSGSDIARATAALARFKSLNNLPLKIQCLK